MNKSRTLFLILLCSLLAGGCATVPQSPIGAGKEAYLKDVCSRNNVLWKRDAVSQVVTLKFKGKQAKVLIGSDLVLIDNDRITLSAPVRSSRSAVIVPKDFQSKVIDLLLQNAQKQKGYGAPKVRKVVIDAGHGGKDPGTIGRTGIHEKKVVLDIAQRLEKILKAKGVGVIMTRDTDQFITLQKRTEIASRAKADLFISIHANASPSRGVSGLEVYTAKHLGFTDKKEQQRKTNHKLMFNTLSMKSGDTNVEKIIGEMLYAHKQAESRVLAAKIARGTSKGLKTKNRGTKTAGFFVLRNTLIPAVLVEIGFLSNAKEENLLKTSSYRQKVARNLAKDILDYVNGK